MSLKIKGEDTTQLVTLQFNSFFNIGDYIAKDPVLYPATALFWPGFDSKTGNNNISLSGVIPKGYIQFSREVTYKMFFEFGVNFDPSFTNITTPYPYTPSSPPVDYGSIICYSLIDEVESITRDTQGNEVIFNPPQYLSERTGIDYYIAVFSGTFTIKFLAGQYIWFGGVGFLASSNFGTILTPSSCEGSVVFEAVS